MKNLLLVLLTIPLLFGSCNKDEDDDVVPESPNTWIKTFGGNSHTEVGRSVQQTSDSGYVVCGTIDYSGLTDVYLLKIDKQGNKVWNQIIGGTGFDNGWSVQQTTDGGFILTGRQSSSGSTTSVYLVKTDENGNEQWNQTFGDSGNNSGYSVQQTTDGGYIITGFTTSLGNGGSDVYLIKTDENGDSLWTRTFGGTSSDRGLSVQQTTDGGFILTGTTQSFGNGGPDVYLIKTDENGDSLWTRTFGGTSSEEGYSVQQTTDGGFILTGTTYSGGSKVYLVKTDENGNEQWSKSLGEGTDQGQSVQQTTDGGYIITGTKQLTYSHVHIKKTDENGVLVWDKIFEESETLQHWGNSIQQTMDGGYIITGHKETLYNSNKYDIYLIKTDENGDVNP